MNAETVAHVARREQLLDRLRRILIEELHLDAEPEEIDPDAALFGSGLGLDSIDAVELWVNLDIVFGLKPDQDPRVRLGGSRTLNTLIDLLLARRQGGTDVA